MYTKKINTKEKNIIKFKILKMTQTNQMWSNDQLVKV